MGHGLCRNPAFYPHRSQVSERRRIRCTLQWGLTLHPEAGDIIPGSGGIRKLRWAGSGRGKRGGLRVIYYWRDSRGEIWLLTIYAKNEAQNIPPHILREFKRELDDG